MTEVQLGRVRYNLGGVPLDYLIGFLFRELAQGKDIEATRQGRPVGPLLLKLGEAARLAAPAPGAPDHGLEGKHAIRRAADGVTLGCKSAAIFHGWYHRAVDVRGWSLDGAKVETPGATKEEKGGLDGTGYVFFLGGRALTRPELLETMGLGAPTPEDKDGEKAPVLPNVQVWQKNTSSTQEEINQYLGPVSDEYVLGFVMETLMLGGYFAEERTREGWHATADLMTKRGEDKDNIWHVLNEAANFRANNQLKVLRAGKDVTADFLAFAGTRMKDVDDPRDLGKHRYRAVNRDNRVNYVIYADSLDLFRGIRRQTLGYLKYFERIMPGLTRVMGGTKEEGQADHLPCDFFIDEKAVSRAEVLAMTAHRRN